MAATPTPTPAPSPVTDPALIESAQFHADVLARMDAGLAVCVILVLVLGVIVVKALW